MTDTFNGTPDFACTESIERTERTAKSAPVQLLPVRVDTGIINGKELYAWPSDNDQRTPLREVLAVFGKAGTGSYALFSRAVFLTAGATFYDAPDETKDGRKLSRVDFTMPPDASTYRVNKDDNPVKLGYSGSIWTEPGSLDVVRMEMQADSIPKETGIQAVTQTFEFTRSKLAGIPVILPVSMDLDLRELSGRQERVTSKFTDCRQYLAKHGDLFVETAAGAPADAAKASTAPPTPESLPWLPAKLVLHTILTEAIDERTLTRGSKLTYTFLQDVKNHGKVIIPKGSTASGHITRIILQTYSLNTSVRRYYLVGIHLDTVDAGSQRYQVRASLDTLGLPNPPTTTESIAFIPYSRDPDKWGTYDDDRTLFLVPPADDGESFLGVVREFLRLGDRITMFWTSLGPP